MPIRQPLLITGETYHIYNRSINRMPIFTTKTDKKHALFLWQYYQFADTPMSYSKLWRLSREARQQWFDKLDKGGKRRVDTLSFCIMPNHYHLLVLQKRENGISEFIHDFQVSQSLYFNLRKERQGPLFESVFKAVRMETEEQLLHVSRYIHLNPYSSFVVKNIKSLLTRPETSLPEYLTPKSATISQPRMILRSFHRNPQEYKKFILDRADYQRSLEEIKHLSLEG